MDKYTVSYTVLKTVDIWAISSSAADDVVQTYPDYYSTLSVVKKDTFSFSLGQTVYYFDTSTDSILQGIVTDLNFITDLEVKVFVRFSSDASSKLFLWPSQTAELYTNLEELISYLGRKLPSAVPSITLPSPSGLSSSSVTTTSFVLNWLSVSGATGYNIYKGGTLLYSNASSPGVLVFDLSPNTAYSMQVSALGTAGESVKSSALNVTTLAQIPSIPNGLVEDVVEEDNFSVTWNPSTGAALYRVYLNSVFVSTSANTNYSFTNLLPNTTYQVQVSAANSGGESNKSATLSVTTAPPLAPSPTGLGVSGVDQNSLTFTWNFVPGADTYKVYLDDVFVGDTGNTVFFIAGLTNGTTYSLSVSSVNSTGESSKATPILVTTDV